MKLELNNVKVSFTNQILFMSLSAEMWNEWWKVEDM